MDSGTRVAATRIRNLTDAALACLGEQGPAGVSVGEITRRCGASQSTFYRYFADPDQCLERAFEEAAGRLLARLLPSSGNASAQIELALENLAVFLAENRLLARALLAEARLAAGPSQRRQEFLKRLSEGLDHACRQEGSHRAPAAAGLFLVGAIEHLAMQAICDGQPRDFAREIPGIVFLVRRTYGLPPAAADMLAPCHWWTSLHLAPY